MAGAATLGNLAGALELRAEESSMVAELKAGSEDAYAWLLNQYQPPVYNLVYRILNDSADAADTTQEVFLKVFRGMKHFNGASSLKTWIYRIAVHEASNRRRWWFRHKARETSMEIETGGEAEEHGPCLREILVDERTSPFDDMARTEMRTRVEQALKEVAEPYRTSLVLRDIEELSYEEIAEVMEVSLGTVKSRLTRGRDALKKKLESFLGQSPVASKLPNRSTRESVARGGREVEVTS